MLIIGIPLQNWFVFMGKPSEQLDLKNNVDYRYRNDAFDLRRASDNPLVENQVGKKDWDKSNKVVGFNVDIGPQNQQIFKSFQVDQSCSDCGRDGNTKSDGKSRWG